MSTSPASTLSRICAASFGLTREVSSTILASGILLVIVRWCCAASTVVGASTAHCLPLDTARFSARIATSVLPKPTSPQMSRSIGLFRQHMSSSTSRKHCI